MQCRPLFALLSSLLFVACSSDDAHRSDPSTVALEESVPTVLDLASSGITIPDPLSTNVIVQLFDWHFADIEAKLPELKELGYTYVLVSPPEKSHPSEEWWGRYQPVDFTVIDSPLGDSESFAELGEVADQEGVKILVDVVLNHMADYPDYVTRDAAGHVTNLQYPRFAVWDFHPPGVSSEQDPIHGWLGLPDLKTESDYVRGQARNYLVMLTEDYSVDGFRFDAIKHIEDGFFEDILTAVDADQLFLFGEYITADPNEMGPYLDSMDAYDFPLAKTMKQAFAWGGDLRTLVDPAASGHALPGPSAVTWVKQHDVAVPRQEPQYSSWDEWRIGGREGGVDEMLAYAYILGREDGTPFVYMDKYDHPLVVAGVRFHNLALGAPEHWIVTEQNQLAWQRGDTLLAALNKHGDPWTAGPLATTLQPGSYLELLTHRLYTVNEDGILQGLTLGGSSAAFLVGVQVP